MAEELVIVFTTWPGLDEARGTVRTVIDEKLAACGNIVPGVESIYRWQGQVETASEVFVIFKTTAARYPALEARIRELHTYEVPEILRLPVTGGLPSYLQWVEDNSLP